MDPLPPLKPDRVLQIVCIAGSQRQGSFNRALRRAATELAPATLRITAHDLLPIPLYNADIESRGAPGVVADLRNAVRAADGLLIATPEYNHGVPGVLKNAYGSYYPGGRGAESAGEADAVPDTDLELDPSKAIDFVELTVRMRF